MRISEEEKWLEVQQWIVEVLRKVRETFDPHIEYCEMMLEEGSTLRQPIPPEDEVGGLD